MNVTNTQPEKKNPTGGSLFPIDNVYVANKLSELAALLLAQGASPFRANAYKKVAATLTDLKSDLSTIYQESGEEGLQRLPHVGRSLARSIAQILKTGKLGYLEKLRGDADIETLLTLIPAIGPQMARRLHLDLAVENYYDLTRALRSGKLGQYPGLGEKRLRAIADFLGDTGLQKEHSTSPPTPTEPYVDELLTLDATYRELAGADQLPKIAPKQNNPDNAAWLPVWDTKTEFGQYTVLFSNTKHAHEMGMTKDWVVIYLTDSPEQKRWTVITANYGHHQGRRIVRGREAECATFYQSRLGQL